MMKRVACLSVFLFCLTSATFLQAETKKEATPETQPETQPAAEWTYPPYLKGDRVEALWHGAWYKGVIERVEKSGELYRVSFYGYWHDRDETLPPERLRPIPKKREYPHPSELKAGDAIEFLEGGDHWRPAVFVELNGKKAKVRWADGQSTREEEIYWTRLFKPTSSMIPKEEAEKMKKEKKK